MHLQPNTSETQDVLALQFLPSPLEDQSNLKKPSYKQQGLIKSLRIYLFSFMSLYDYAKQKKVVPSTGRSGFDMYFVHYMQKKLGRLTLSLLRLSFGKLEVVNIMRDVTPSQKTAQGSIEAQQHRSTQMDFEEGFTFEAEGSQRAPQKHIEIFSNIKNQK